jgi:hypothetical protein
MYFYAAIGCPVSNPNLERSPVGQIEQFDQDGRNDCGPQESVKFHPVEHLTTNPLCMYEEMSASPFRMRGTARAPRANTDRYC